MAVSDQHEPNPRDVAEFTPSAAGVPSDNTTLVAVLARLEAAGYDAQFIVTDDAMIECAGCGGRLSPDEFEVDEWQRLEGASDPADMMVIAAARCRSCGRTGTIVMGYGPNASGGDGAVLLALRDSNPSG